MHQPDQLMREDSSNDTGQTSPIRQSAQILAGTVDFVPTGLGAMGEENRDWQTAMRTAIRSSAELRRVLGLPEEDQQREINFPTFVPWEYIARIRPGDPEDPLLRQVLPVADEHREVPGFITDPVGDLDSLAAGGVLHKYKGRALLIATGACGVHCRYCFRREFPYSQAGSQTENWRPAIEYVDADSTIDEVILSGGDPLTLVDHKLDELIDQIEQIPHVKRLRIHTRMPVVIPQRVTDELVDCLASSRLATWFVIHANHPNELDETVFRQIGKLVNRGIPVLNQAVLLRGINDDSETMIQLCRKLVDHRIQPYYLHQLDRVRGSAHFEVPIEEGNRIMAALREALPGYAVPTYVTEQPAQTSKTLISHRVDG